MQIDYTEEIRHIALKIKALRKERKLTVQELAYRCDIERSNLSRLETGRSNPTIKTLCIICNALDVPLRSLIEYRVLQTCRDTTHHPDHVLLLDNI